MVQIDPAACIGILENGTELAGGHFPRKLNCGWMDGDDLFGAVASGPPRARRPSVRLLDRLQ